MIKILFENLHPHALIFVIKFSAHVICRVIDLIFAVVDSIPDSYGGLFRSGKFCVAAKKVIPLSDGGLFLSVQNVHRRLKIRFCPSGNHSRQLHMEGL